MEKLKPCPFKDVEKAFPHDLYYDKDCGSICCRCGARGSIGAFTKDTAIKSWNTRALKLDEGEIKKVVFSAMYYGEYDENDEIKMADVEPVSDAIVKYLEGKKALEPLPSKKEG